MERKERTWCWLLSLWNFMAQKNNYEKWNYILWKQLVGLFENHINTYLANRNKPSKWLKSTENKIWLTVLGRYFPFQKSSKQTISL